MGFDLEDFFRCGAERRSGYRADRLASYAKRFAVAIAVWGVAAVLLLSVALYLGWSLASPYVSGALDTLDRQGINGLLDGLRPLWDRIMNGREGAAS